MASLRQSASAASVVCKQTANCRLASSVASVQMRSPLSSLSSVSHRALCKFESCFHFPSVAPRSLFSLRPSSSQITLSSRQTRTFLTQLRRQAQALKEQPISSSTPLPKQAKQPQSALQLNNLPYFVRRTGSNQLPVYLVTKAGGTKQLTKIQKTEGDLDALRSDLALTLGIDTRSPDVSINRLNGHIIVKGWRKPEIVKFLQERNF
ncbi:Phosphopantothenoylcysteine decarboxylase [Penicillium macrosclerotiorum]|uniref:Phosphopantothenoylcysteine decarboxylase n=1 Tax=Penicillium macrosclerotiorum TaxID=303699 RepID=UPI002548B7D6|nr:Phosphopantothenoylcysteine decarboxylase [Penicillium macrosclerotiorum]KAJ5674020.1 Phosphopantothenoylcysteine decarboxylase [Penicillium macrosclerotiorum]